MPEFVDWAAARDRAALLRRSTEVLDAGGWVAFPTETGHAIAARADRPDAMLRIPAGGLRWSLSLPDQADVLAWTGPLVPAAVRMVRRTWPGPAAFAFTGAARSEPAARLHEAVRSRLDDGGGLTLRRPAHPAILNVLAAAEGPLVLGEAAAGVAGWLAPLGDAVELVLEDGPPHFDQPATIIRVNGAEWTVAAEGVYDAEELRRLTACLILFICTGNTCRSPMAEAMFKALLAERLGCGVVELPARGFWVMSAGVSACAGDPSPQEARNAVAAFGADLSEHRSRPVRPELLDAADHVVAMTQDHLAALDELFPGVGGAQLLCGAEDLPDPVGHGQEVYDECARIIRAHLEDLAAEVTGS